ncbi:hypothetical protein Aple_070290 [Acrocarpospora pleiomorpha]|uniref:Deoxyribonuclease NucA/NucB domain-containing protein n=1 Tax=Acrocarpospora pleiomorpha TaxID=90975 RepID=A0A5M3XTG3_9ACTN|nr:hypothetical protein [Acrocarpospora pleiomorpha]GES24130.1 hypothetical protein Aple_070290 [Acrocarpospora pleiomorpha]
MSTESTRDLYDYLSYIVSGHAGRGAPLHRIWAREEQDSPLAREKNRACALLTKLAGYDKYPFASAYEGAGRNDAGELTANTSYKYVPQHDNGRAGTALRWFCQRYRVLIEDPFWVLISPGPEPTS